MSKVIFKETQKEKASRLITAMQKVTEQPRTEISGQYGRTIKVQTGNVTILNSDLDIEFNIPFDDDTEANEAESLELSTDGETYSAANITCTSKQIARTSADKIFIYAYHV